jgi:hypothetical protein
MTNQEMETAIRQLQDASTVMAALEARHAVMMKDHAEWLVAHDKAIAEARERGKATDARIEALGERIDKLVSGVGAWMRRTDGPEESK